MVRYRLSRGGFLTIPAKALHNSTSLRRRLCVLPTWIGERSMSNVILCSNHGLSISTPSLLEAVQVEALRYQLAQHGCRVLLIEQGDFLAPDRTNSSDPIGRYIFDVVDDRDDASGFVGGETNSTGRRYIGCASVTSMPSSMKRGLTGLADFILSRTLL